MMWALSLYGAIYLTIICLYLKFCNACERHRCLSPCLLISSQSLSSALLSLTSFNCQRFPTPLPHPSLTHTHTHTHIQPLQANKDPTWSSQNYLSQRALTHATSVRSQLGALLQKAGVNTSLSCAPEKDPFLKCLTAGDTNTN
jgi:hypothetical protein